MNVIFGAYSRVLLNLKCQNFDVSRKRGAPKTNLLSANAYIQFHTENKTKCLFLAHLSQRLIGELIVYQCSSVRRRRCCPPFSNVFSSKTAWPIKAKFYVEPPWEGGTKVYINGPGHMTKMAAMPIYGKNLKKSSSPEPEVL